MASLGKQLWLPVVEFRDRTTADRFCDLVLDALRRQYPAAFDGRAGNDRQLANPAAYNLAVCAMVLLRPPAGPGATWCNFSAGPRRDPPTSPENQVFVCERG
jgi:hypothetical protein